jgi:hypothetical protein
MDVSELQRDLIAPTNNTDADGEIVWSRYSDASIKLATTRIARRTGDGGQKARRTGEITYKPLKPLRREGRMIGSYLW